MTNSYLGERCHKLLLLTHFLYFITTFNQYVKAENMQMTCPDENAPPLDIVFFYQCFTYSHSIMSLIKKMTREFYWSPDDPTKGVSITIVIFYGEGSNKYTYHLVGVRSSEELLESLSCRRGRTPPYYAFSDSFTRLERYAQANPDPVIFRSNSDKVLVYILDDDMRLNPFDPWDNALISIHSRVRVMFIATGSEFDGNKLRQATSPPRLERHSYWWLSGNPLYTSSDFGEIQELVHLYREIAWSICSRDNVSVPARIPPPMPCPGEIGNPIDLVFIVVTNNFVTPEDFEHVKTFLISLGYYFHMKHYDPNEGVEISIINVDSDRELNRIVGKRSFYSLQLEVNEMRKGSGRTTNLAYQLFDAYLWLVPRQERSPPNYLKHTVFVVITNLEVPASSNRILKSNAHMLKFFFDIITIGIGNRINEEQLRDISSPPRLENHNYFLLDSYDQLPPLARNFSWAVCTNLWHSSLPNPPEEPVRDEIPMPCPGAMQPPLDLVFFIPTSALSNTEYDLVKTFLVSMTDYLYLTPTYPSTGVYISVVIFGLQAEVRLTVEGVSSRADLETSLNLINSFPNASSEVFAENTTEQLLLRYVDSRPDQRILREEADHVFIFIINRLFNDSRNWRTKIEESLSTTNAYDYMNIAIGDELDYVEDIRESVSLPRLRNHNYWHLHSFQEMIEKVSNITWSICTRRMNPVPPASILPEVTTVEQTTIAETTTVEETTFAEETSTEQTTTFGDETLNKETTTFGEENLTEERTMFVDETSSGETTTFAEENSTEKTTTFAKENSAEETTITDTETSKDVAAEDEDLVDCGDPPWPSHGSVTFTRTRVHSSAIYSCDSGYTSNQTLIRVCGINGKWQGETIKCLPVGETSVKQTSTLFSQRVTTFTNVTLSAGKLTSNKDNKQQQETKVAFVSLLPVAALVIVLFGCVMFLCGQRKAKKEEERQCTQDQRRDGEKE